MSMTKILVVEDEGLTAMEIQRKLRNWGYDVPSFAFSRKEAVKKAKEIKPDLILMDIMLKGQGDGVDAAQEIKNIQDIPIIYITAYDDVETRKRAAVTNPTAYLIKPFEETELHNKIETALSEHKTEKTLLDIGKRLDNESKGFGVIVIDLKGIIIYINGVASNLIGFKEDMAVYKELSQVFPMESLKKDKDGEDYLKVLIENNASVTSRSILKGEDGKDVHVEYTLNSILDEKNGILGAELVFKDITQDIRDEISLMEREKKFRGIYYQSMLASEIFDMDGKFLDANPACLDLFGAANINQLKKFNLFKDFKLNPEEIQTLKNGLEFKYECEFNSEELIESGFNKTSSDGIIYLSLFITPLKKDGLTDGYLVQFQDITDHHKLEESLKNSEERYLKFLDTLDEVLIVFNSAMKCVYCNHIITELLDLKAEDLIGKSFQEAMKSFWDEELETMCLETLESGNSSSTIKTYQKNKTSKYIEIKSFKSSEGLTILLKDVSKIKEREEELKRNERLYRSVVDHQSEMVCRFNKDFELTFANETYYRYFGINDKSKLVFSISREDTDKMKAQFESFDEENHIKIFEGPLRLQNGNISWWQWVTSSTFDEEGNILEYQSVGRDVTAHHETMEKSQNDLKELQSTIEEKNKELESLKNSFDLEIKEGKQKISSIERLNDDISKKFQEESEKFKDTIESQESELKISNEREKALKDSVRLLEEDIQIKTVELEDARKNLESEINISKKIDAELKKTAQDLEKQIGKTDWALSKMTNLNKEIEGKKVEISQLKSGFEAEILNLKEAESKTRESLQRKEKTLKEVYNGVRKNMQMISTLNRLHSEYVTDQMIEKLQDGQSYLRSFGTVHEKLYQSEDLETVDLGKYLDSIMDDISRSHGAKNVDIKTNTNDVSLDMETAVLSGLIISELVINSLKHAFPSGDVGEIVVEVFYENENLVIKVSDNGVGIPPHISVENADSFGLQLVKTFVEQSEGSIDLKGDNGANFIIKIPKT